MFCGSSSRCRGLVCCVFVVFPDYSHFCFLLDFTKIHSYGTQLTTVINDWAKFWPYMAGEYILDFEINPVSQI